MQIHRLFEMIYVLLDKPRVTAKELAARFEVSPRTILRDVDTLAAAGIPIYTTAGRSGGISLMEGFVLDKTVLTQEERGQILLSLQSLSAAQHVDADAGLRRLHSLFGDSEEDWIEVDFSRWGHGEADSSKFALLKRAILGRHALTFTYVGSYGPAGGRHVYPCKLVFKGKAWYLQGARRPDGQMRTFKINRMWDVALLDERFEPLPTPPKIDPPTAAFVQTTPVELLVQPHAAYRVYDELEPENIMERDDGSVLLSADLPEDAWLLGYILSFGAAMEVLHPLHLRAAVAQHLGAWRKLYEQKR